MFHMSLGSKELFHSNFLEFLWNHNSQAFLNMLFDLLPDDAQYEKKYIKDLSEKNNLKLAREKNNFDICIYHEEGNKEIFDIIIENKVKSIPYKSQLDKYVDKVGLKHGTPIFILLSLVKDFAQRNEICEQKKWIIVHYNQMANSLTKFFKSQNQYINDYCQLVSSLADFDDYIETMNGVEYSQVYDAVKKIRLHDLFLKLKGSTFVGKLYKLVCNKISQEVVTIDVGEREDKRFNIFLSNSFNNGKNTITAAIMQDRIQYAIQIEGNQYRHMYIAKGMAKKSCDATNKKINSKKLEKYIRSTSALYFLWFEEKFHVPQLLGDLNKKYCRYGADIVYRYKKYSDNEDMLVIMADDIVNTYKILYPLN